MTKPRKPRAVITPELHDAIVEQIRLGTDTAIGERLGVSHMTVYSIRSGWRLRNLKPHHERLRAIRVAAYEQMLADPAFHQNGNFAIKATCRKHGYPQKEGAFRAWMELNGRRPCSKS